MSLAAAVSDLQVEYIDGVTEVKRNILPPGGKEQDLSAGGLERGERTLTSSDSKLNSLWWFI